MQNQDSQLSKFVQDRLMLRIINEDEEKREAAKQGVSIRLDPGRVRGLDFMAKELDLSRQALLLEIITSGLNEIITAWATEQGEKAQEAYRQVADLMSLTSDDY